MSLLFVQVLELISTILVFIVRIVEKRLLRLLLYFFSIMTKKLDSMS